MTLATYELFERCRTTGDDESWELFFARCSGKLRRVMGRAVDGILRYLEPVDVDDLDQELRCRLLAAPCAFAGTTDGEVWSYLWRSVGALISDRRRQHRTAKRCRSMWRRERMKLDELPSPDPGPEDLLLSDESWREFLALCARCVPEERRSLARRVVELTLLEGCNSLETSRQLAGQLSAKQIDNLMCQIRQRLAVRGIELPRRVGGRSRSRPGPGRNQS